MICIHLKRTGNFKHQLWVDDTYPRRGHKSNIVIQSHSENKNNKHNTFNNRTHTTLFM